MSDGELKDSDGSSSTTRRDALKFSSLAVAGSIAAAHSTVAQAEEKTSEAIIRSILNAIPVP